MPLRFGKGFGEDFSSFVTGKIGGRQEKSGEIVPPAGEFRDPRLPPPGSPLPRKRRAIAFDGTRRWRRRFPIVMAGLDPAIHAFVVAQKERRGCPGQARA
jgi:hypothetical protein